MKGPAGGIEPRVNVIVDLLSRSPSINTIDLPKAALKALINYAEVNCQQMIEKGCLEKLMLLYGINTMSDESFLVSMLWFFRNLAVTGSQNRITICLIFQMPAGR